MAVPSRAVVTLPNLLSASRLVLAPFLLGAGLGGRVHLYLVLLAWSLLSDFFDGKIAWLLRQTTEFGARLDSAADCAFYLAAPLGAWAAFPVIRAEQGVTTAVILASYALPVLYGFQKYRRLTAYHTLAARAVGALLPAGFVLLLAAGEDWLLHAAAVVLALSAMEEIAITASLPRWRTNVPSLRAAHRLGRSPVPASSPSPRRSL